MSVQKVVQILEDNKIDPNSQIGQKLIKKYEVELSKKRETLAKLEEQMLELAEKDFLESI